MSLTVHVELQAGLLLFGATCIMTMGLASIVILPMHFYRYVSLFCNQD